MHTQLSFHKGDGILEAFLCVLFLWDTLPILQSTSEGTIRLTTQETGKCWFQLSSVHFRKNLWSSSSQQFFSSKVMPSQSLPKKHTDLFFQFLNWRAYVRCYQTKQGTYVPNSTPSGSWTFSGFQEIEKQLKIQGNN